MDKEIKSSVEMTDEELMDMFGGFENAQSASTNIVEQPIDVKPLYGIEPPVVVKPLYGIKILPLYGIKLYTESKTDHCMELILPNTNCYIIN